jgi:acylphosphatase
MIQHLNIKIYGQVQGVLFRSSTENFATKLGITGFIKNEPDETVYIEAEGEMEDLNRILDWCKSGPQFAKVTKLEVTFGELKNFSQFLIS